MKIWSDSLSYLNNIRGGYMVYVERILSSKYNNKSDGDGQYFNDHILGEKSSYDADRPNRSFDCDDDEDPWSDWNKQRSAESPYNAWTQFSRNQEHVSRLARHHLQLATTLHIQPCDASNWLICNPIQAGKIAVIDEEAHSLLECFRMPTTLQELVARSHLPGTSLLAIALIFLDLHFLRDLDEALVAHSEKSAPSTLSAWLHITNACNLRCHYCYVSKSPDHMAPETSQRAIDAVIRSAVRHGYQRVHLKYAGGEAALQMPQVITTHDYAQKLAQEHQLQLSAGLLSNGTIMTQRMIEQLKERHIHTMLSLDGIGATHDQQRSYINGAKGSFAMVDRTISRLLANNLQPSINVTVSQRNIAGLPALLSYILERDLPFSLSYYRENDCSASITDLQFSETQMIDGMRAAFIHLEQHLPRRRIIDGLIDKGSMYAPHHYTCGIGRNYLVINQRGEVAKCQMDMARTVTTIHAADPLHEIRSDPNGIQAIDVDQKEGCRTCTWRYWCGGGCPLVTYRMTGRNDIRSPNCAIYQALYPDAVRLEALRLLKYETPVLFENPYYSTVVRR